MINVFRLKCIYVNLCREKHVFYNKILCLLLYVGLILYRAKWISSRCSNKDVLLEQRQMVSNK